VATWRPSGAWRRRAGGLDALPATSARTADLLSVLNEGYATKIARGWNTKDRASGYVGYVLRSEVDADHVSRFEPQRVGGAGIEELWVPAQELVE
jgi:hypothetical protein